MYQITPKPPFYSSTATEQLAEDCCNAATQLVQLNADNKDAKNTSQMPRSLRMMVGRLCATAAKCLCPAKYTVKELYNRAAAKMWLLQVDSAAFIFMYPSLRCDIGFIQIICS